MRETAMNADSIQYALETDWPVGAAGFETPHQESCPMGVAIVRADGGFNFVAIFACP
jgi:hypothetical protein